jgi:hypothetical protein
MDLSKLTPASEWKVKPSADADWPGAKTLFFGAGVARFTAMREAFVRPTERDIAETQAAAEMCLLARRALDIQIRRGWAAIRDFDGWCVIDDCCQVVRPDSFWPDPYTALLETEKWFIENVESKAGKA